MKVSELKDNELYRKLIAAHPSDEGNLLENTDGSEQAQVNFLCSIITKYKPEFVAETGTNKSLFGYMLSRVLENPCVLYTFDRDPISSKCVALLNQFQTTIDAHFFLGNTLQTMGEQLRHMRKLSNSKRVLAWVDGGHDFVYCLNDLMHMAAIPAQYIFVDDYLGSPDVRDAVAQFLQGYPYSFHLTPYKEDKRGIILLKRNI